MDDSGSGGSGGRGQAKRRGTVRKGYEEVGVGKVGPLRGSIEVTKYGLFYS